MKKKLWLVISGFVLMSVVLFTTVGCVFFFGNRGNASAAKGNTTVSKAFYSVEFDTRGGSAIDTKQVANGQRVTKPKQPTFKNYEFLGWYLDLNDTEQFDFDTPITSDLVLYAKWNVITYVVSFDCCGGTTVVDQAVVKGEYLDEPTTTWTGYEFLGWYTDEAYTKQFDFNQPLMNDLTLYAKWSIEFKLSMDGQSYRVSAYHGTSPVITIPAVYRGKPVLSIGRWVFENCQTLTEVVIEEGILSIDRCAFYGCSNLTKVQIPSAIEIDEDAFRGCPVQIN